MGDANYFPARDGDGQVEYLFRCDCADDHFLNISWWPEDRWDTDLGFEGTMTVSGGFWENLKGRAKMAWKVLFTRHADTNVGLVLSQEKARDIINALERFVHDAEASRERRDAERAAGNGRTP